jgi:hypothetical protein
MKLTISVYTVSRTIAEGRYVQRQVIRREIDFPDDETLDDVCLTAGVRTQDETTSVVLICK